MNNKPFVFLLLFRFLTTVAMQMKMTILSYFLYLKTQDPLILGYLGLIEAFPKIGISLPAGYIVEQMEKRKALLIVVITYLIGVLGIALTISFLQDSKWFLGSIYSFIFIMGIVGSLGASASVSIFSNIVPKEKTPRYAAINSNAWQIGAITGPILAGFLIKKIGIEKSMYYTVLILAFSVFSVFILPKVKSYQSIGFDLYNSINQIKEGLNFVFSNKIMFWAISLDLFAVLFGGSVALLPIFAEDILKVDAAGYGWLKSAMPLGAAISMFFLAAKPLNRKTGKWLLVSVGMFGVFTILFAISKNWYLSLVSLFLMGAFDAISVIIRSTLLYLETPENMKARVASVNQMFISSSNEIGAFESGFAAKLFGTIPSVIFGGSMTIFFVILAFIKAKKLVRFEFLNYQNIKK